MTSTDDKLDAILVALGGLTDRVAALEQFGPAEDGADEELARQYARDPDSVCAWCHAFPIVLGEPCPRCGNRAAARPDAGPPMGDVLMEHTSAGVVIQFPVPTAERLEQRRLLERQQLRLATVLGDDSEDWTERYAQGGPFWLYTHRRDLVITYPQHVLKAMIADVEQDSPKLAYEMSLDVLKAPANEPDLETGAGSLHVSNLTTDKVKH